jgi:glycosyltransferase involved in cell wall biosynthesis
MHGPSVSIITVVFNAGNALENTIKSVLSQTYPNIEHIIIDGLSSDSTVQIIKKYESKLGYWKSEQDKGIYDAMNKGLKAAKGDYVWFLNAGDELYSNDIVKFIFSGTKNADVYYGETMDIDTAGNEIGLRRLKTPEKLNWRSLNMGMVVCHQSILIKKDIVKNYDLRYSISADIDWIIDALRKAKTVSNTHLILSKFQIGGMSRNNIVKGLFQRFFIMVRYYGFFPTAYNHILIGFKFFRFLFKNKRF